MNIKNLISYSLAGGIAAALLKQAKTGEGSKVIVSLFSQAIWNLSALVSSTQYGDEYPKSRKEAITPVINSYRCKDDKWVFLSILEHERYYEALCDVIERPDLKGEEKFSTNLKAKENAKEMIEVLDKEFAKYTQDELVERLTNADIAHERIQHVLEALNDPQAEANNYVVEVENRNGSKVKAAMPPVKFDTIEKYEVKDAPNVGQDNEEVLKTLGYTDEQIKELYDAGVLAKK